MDLFFTPEIQPVNRRIPGCDAYLSKTGPSIAPSRLATETFNDVEFASLRLGHPATGRIEASSDRFVVILVRSAHPSSRWDGNPVGVGSVYLYPPGSRHMSNSRAGLEMGLFSIRLAALAAALDTLVRVIDSRPYRVVSGPVADVWSRTYDWLMSENVDDVSIAAASLSELIAITNSLETDAAGRADGPRELDLSIIRRVEDYLTRSGRWRLSTREIIGLTGFSDRRVQLAFKRGLSTTPGAWMRARALSAARTRLTAGNRDSVSRIAMDHDFEHFSRFSQYYRDLYGELPSATRATP